MNFNEFKKAIQSYRSGEVGSSEIKKAKLFFNLTDEDFDVLVKGEKKAKFLTTYYSRLCEEYNRRKLQSFLK